MPHVLVYERYSERDAVGRARASQLTSLLEHLSPHAVVGRIVESGPGGDDSRPMLKALEAVVESGAIDAVVVTDLERLSRVPERCQALQDLCRQHGVHLFNLTAVPDPAAEAVSVPDQKRDGG